MPATQSPLKEKVARLRTILLEEPSDELRPWICTPFKTKLKLKDTPFPYTTDGMISPSGYFFDCGPCGHDAWCLTTIGLTSGDLVKSGWVVVWSYESIFYKPGHTKTPYFRYNNDLTLTAEQRARMVSWCEGQKTNLKRALMYNYDSFMED